MRTDFLLFLAASPRVSSLLQTPVETGLLAPPDRPAVGAHILPRGGLRVRGAVRGQLSQQVGENNIAQCKG